jgi:hypothetical protein
MTTYTLGQRVRTLVDDAGAMWPGAYSAPAGTLGTITGLPIAPGAAYGVTLDTDPDQLPANYQPDEITAV